MLQQDDERLRRVLAAKCAGALNLDRLTQHLELDFFINFSSAVASLGAPGQANYAAANAYLDAFAAWRRARGLSAQTVNWGPWAEIGLAADLAARDRERWTRRGVSPMAPREALEILGALMQAQHGQTMVIDLDCEKYLAATPDPAQRERLSRLVRDAVPSEAEPASFVEDYRAAAPADRDGLLATEIQQQIAKVLGLPADETVGQRARLFDLGLDSLMALELKNRFENRFAERLPSTLVFDHPTVGALLEFFRARFGTTPATGAATDNATAIDSDADLDIDEVANLLAQELGDGADR